MLSHELQRPMRDLGRNEEMSLSRLTSPEFNGVERCVGDMVAGIFEDLPRGSDDVGAIAEDVGDILGTGRVIGSVRMVTSRSLGDASPTLPRWDVARAASEALKECRRVQRTS